MCCELLRRLEGPTDNILTLELRDGGPGSPEFDVESFEIFDSSVTSSPGSPEFDLGTCNQVKVGEYT